MISVIGSLSNPIEDSYRFCSFLVLLLATIPLAIYALAAPKGTKINFSLTQLLFVLLIFGSYMAVMMLVSERWACFAEEMCLPPPIQPWEGWLYSVLWTANACVIYQFAAYQPEVHWSKLRRALDTFIAWSIAIVLSLFGMMTSQFFMIFVIHPPLTSLK